MENTFFCVFNWVIHEDHLHIRGEHEDVSSLKVGYLGSPPHTWRTQKKGGINLILPRITSTYVENTVGKCRLAVVARDHLHIRGEHLNRHVEVLA